jgi:adenylyltransferase/sulfurtransferase
LGVLPGVIGLIQATETIKLITGLGEPLVGRLLLYDALAMRFSTLAIAKDLDCPVCGDHPSITSLREEDTTCDVGVGTSADQASEPGIQPRELRAMLDRGERLVLLDVREPYEREIASLANTHEIPLGELDTRTHELPEDRDIVVYCRSGVRSAQAAAALRRAGFDRVHNLERGILGWIDDVDPTLARY